MKRKYSIDDMNRIAEKRGGSCVSLLYMNPHTKLRWRCEQGHEWEAMPLNVMHGTWCPVCSGHLRLGLDRMKAHAAKMGGKCRSRSYVNARSPLKWQCGHGHEWSSDADHVIRRGQWCPGCQKRRYSLEDMQRLARERGGECLSTKYTNAQQQLKWECKSGHVWLAKGVNVLAGTWCPTCAGRVKLTIKEMREIARSRGGFCRSVKYHHNHHKLEWQCEHGHRWKAVPSSVKRGTWCPICTRGTRATIREANRLAARYGGKCLSRAIADSRSELKWECSKGHQWYAPYASVKFRSWCPSCNESAGEALCRSIFEKIFGKPFPRTRSVRWLKSSLGKPLELDGYCAELKIAFEYNGNQHYDPEHIFNRDADFERRRACDEQKKRLCAKHGVTIAVISEFPNIGNVVECENRIQLALTASRVGPNEPGDVVSTHTMNQRERTNRADQFPNLGLHSVPHSLNELD